MNIFNIVLIVVIILTLALEISAIIRKNMPAFAYASAIALIFVGLVLTTSGQENLSLLVSGIAIAIFGVMNLCFLLFTNSMRNALRHEELGNIQGDLAEITAERDLYAKSFAAEMITTESLKTGRDSLERAYDSVFRENQVMRQDFINIARDNAELEGKIGGLIKQIEGYKAAEKQMKEQNRIVFNKVRREFLAKK
jgi:hypothetical protein